MTFSEKNKLRISTVLDGKLASSGGGAARALCAASPHITFPWAASLSKELTFCIAKCKTRAAPLVWLAEYIT